MRYYKIIAVFLITCSVITSGIFAYYLHRYNQTQIESNNNAIQEAINQLEYSEHESRYVRDQLFSTVSLLSHGSRTYDYVLNSNITTRTRFEHVLSSVVKGQKWFTGVSFIDQLGVHEIRINYLPRTDDVELVNPAEDISQSSFFQYAKSLEKDEVGFWAEELESSPDTFITPNSPMIHVVTPVFISSEKKGYILISVGVSALIEQLNYSPKVNMTPAIIGSNGFLVTARNSLPFYSDFTRRYNGHRFPESFPRVWQAMKAGEGHYLFEDNNLFVFKSLEDFFGKRAYLVIHFSLQQLEHQAEYLLNDVVKEGFFVFMIMLIFALPTVSMALHYYHRNIESKLARAALDGMTAVMISDKSHLVMMVNKEFEKTIGLSGDEIRGHNALKTLLSHNGTEFIVNVLAQVDENNFWEGEVECITPEGQFLTTIMRIQAILESGKVSYYITSLVDISERKELENKLRELSEKDSLTHLWNRRKFERELTQQTQLVERYVNGYAVSLCLIDIDYFKRVNDEQGHDEGDKVIIKVAKILSQELRTTDFIARIGGEEFAVIMPHTHVDEAEIVVERLRLAVELDESLPITISAGISDLSKDSNRSYKCADIALYESKTLGRNQVSLCVTSDEIA